MLDGSDSGPRRDIVLLNAAAVLGLAADDWVAGLAAARQAIDSGAAERTLDGWIARTQSFAAG